MSQKNPDKKIIVVLPAYNAEKTLLKTYQNIPKDFVDEIILVDDFSQDNTLKIAQRLQLVTIRHPENQGYGKNQKTCYDEALKRKADIVIMLHPDYQYDPKMIPRLIEPILKHEAEAVFGSRILNGEALKFGMPYWKYLGNRFLTFLENFVLNRNLSEYHTGYRVYSSRLLKSIPYHHNSDNFVFDTQITIQIISKNFIIKEVPIKARYFKDASSTSFLESLWYGFETIVSLAQYKIHQWGIRKFDWLK